MVQSKSTSASNPRILNRYIGLGATLDMLQERRIALLSPETWEDRNDRHYMGLYREKKKCAKIFALCGSTRATETFHHWKIFAGSPDGVKVTLNLTKLQKGVKSADGGVWSQGRMDYLMLSGLSADAAIPIQKLPFCKRMAFEDEKEYRVIVETDDASKNIHYLPLDLDWIERITFAPWMPKGIAESVRDTIRGIDGCEKFKIALSTLLENQRWRDFGNKVAGKKSKD